MTNTTELHRHEIGPIRRKRGRPSGHNRMPLGLEQRRAQNAQYERERRDEERAGFTELAQALAGDSSWSKVQILGEAIHYLQHNIETNTRKQTVEDIKRQNEIIKQQIKMLEKQLDKS